LDVLSRHAQWNKGYAVQSLGEGNPHSPWQELVVENCRTSPAELASLRIDFTEWIQRLDQFRRRVALRLATGDTTKEAARYFQISASRISLPSSQDFNAWYESGRSHCARFRKLFASQGTSHTKFFKYYALNMIHCVFPELRH
jgi:hypothetical protein